MAVVATSAEYAASITAMRNCLAKGINLTGPELRVALRCLLDGTQEIAGITDVAESDFLDGNET